MTENEKDPERAERQREISSDEEATMAFDGDATLDANSADALAAPGHAAPGDLPADLPQSIGKYRILGKLGEGGMGVVLEAEQQNPKRRVALKVIRGGHFVDDEQIRMFQREADTLALLKHANIGAIYESGHTEAGRHFFAMELVRGKTLDDYLAGRPSTLDAEELEHRLALFRKIADAVHYAHQRGVIHRDLKPSNIVVPELEGDDESVSGSGVPEIKILDFGLARITEGDMAAVTMQSEVGLIKGTLPYMSPEQARGVPGEIDLRTDVYALGVMLYEMLVGQRPYDVEKTSLIEAVRVIHEAALRPMRQLWQGSRKLDEDLETIVGKALEKGADERYGSAAALSEDVGRYLTSQPILARPPSTVYQLKKLVARNKLGATFAATVLLLLIGFGIWMSLLWRQSEAARMRAEASKLVALGRIEVGTSPSSALAYARASLGVADDPAVRRFALEMLWRGPTALIGRDAPSVGPAFSAEGDYLAVGTHDFEMGASTSALIASTGEQVGKLSAQPQPPVFNAFDASGSRLYLKVMEETAVKSFSVPEGEFLGDLELGTVSAVLQSSDRRHWITLEQTWPGPETPASEVSAVVRRWSGDGGELVSEARIPGQQAGPFGPHLGVDATGESIAYVHEGRLFVGDLGRLDREAARIVGRHEGADLALWHPSAPVVVTGGHLDEELRFWALDGGSDAPVRTLASGPFSAHPTFDPTGRYLAVGSSDGKARIWDLQAPPDAAPLVLEQPTPDRMTGIAYHPSAPWLFTADSTAGTFWPLISPWPYDLRSSGDPVNALAFDPSGRWLLTSTAHESGGHLWPLEGSTSGTALEIYGRSMAISPDGARVAVVQDATMAYVFDLDRREHRPLAQGDFWEVALSGDGRYVAASGGQFVPEDARVKIWDLETGEDFGLDAGDGKFVIDVIFIADGRVVASGDGGVRIWSLETRDFVTVSEEMSGYLAATPDDRQLLVLTGEDTEMRIGGRLVVHDLESGAARELVTHGDTVNAFALDPEGGMIVTGDTAGRVRFGPLSGEEPHLLLGHGTRVESVAIDPRGRWIASGDTGGLTKLWPIPEGRPFHTLPLDEILRRLDELTTYRIVADDQAPDGYRLETAPFQGWQNLPTW